MKYHFETSEGSRKEFLDDAKASLRVAFILSPDFTLLPMAGFVDVLRLAADKSDDSKPVHCQWEFVSQDYNPIRSSCGVEITPTQLYADPIQYDYIVVVGGRLKEHHRHFESTFDYLRRAYDSNNKIVALCSGAFVLADAGIIDDHRICCHYAIKEQLVAKYPTLQPVTDTNYIEDGNIITCPGSIAAIDLAIHLVSKHCSKAQAVKASHFMLVEPEGELLSGYGNVCDWDVVNRDSRLRAAIRIMQMNIDNPLTIPDLAFQLGTTERSLHRLFTKELNLSPSEILRSMRLEHGRNILMNTNRAITQIALESGFADTAHFSRVFKSRYGSSPKQYRAEHQTA